MVEYLVPILPPHGPLSLFVNSNVTETVQGEPVHARVTGLHDEDTLRITSRYNGKWVQALMMQWARKNRMQPLPVLKVIARDTIGAEFHDNQ